MRTTFPFPQGKWKAKRATASKTLRSREGNVTPLNYENKKGNRIAFASPQRGEGGPLAVDEE